MAKNKNLHAAKRAKNDEFYTQMVDIENELKYYKDRFKGKTIFMNCDDPEESNFWKYFHLNFEFFGLKKIISTHYLENQKSYMLEYEGGNDVDTSVGVKTNLEGDGDFRSEESINLLKESDIVITNPPFSLYRTYVAQLIEYEKKFIIMGNQNAITYKEIFPLIKENKIWLGVNTNKTIEFQVPDNYDHTKNGRIDVNGNKYVKVPAISWFTNLEHYKRNEEIILWKSYNEEDNPKYDNYDAIEVSKVKEIPEDYYGVMGVPITFLNKYNPNQFEILGITDRQNTSGMRTKKYTKKDSNRYNDLNARSVLKLKNGNYKQVYARILIKRKDQN